MTVYLGFLDQLVLPTHGNAIGWFTDKMGGEPNWMHDGPDVGLPRCAECGSCLLLVTQLCCQLDVSFYRVLYVFSCLHKKCRGKPHCWRVFRSQMKVDQTADFEKREELKVSEQAPPTDWCDDADNWGDEGEESVAMETINQNHDKALTVGNITSEGVSSENSTSLFNTSDVARQLSALNIHKEQLTVDISLKESTESSEPKQLQSEDLATSGKTDGGNSKYPQFASYFISTVAESETLQGTTDKHVLKLLKDYERREGSSYREDFMEDSGGTGEKYEKAEIKHGDRTLYKFKKCLQDNPEQCIRYEWRGNPLLISDVTKSTLSIPPCPHCGEHRVFECQLMPALAVVLKLEPDTDGVLEFGTVLVFCCQGSCWGSEASLREEVAFLMHYPDHALFNT